MQTFLDLPAISRRRLRLWGICSGANRAIETRQQILREIELSKHHRRIKIRLPQQDHLHLAYAQTQEVIEGTHERIQPIAKTFAHYIGLRVST
jgi:hypothetical protein